MRRAACFAIVLAATGCNEAGRARIAFVLSDVPSDADSLWLHARVREAGGRELGGVVERYAAGIQLSLVVPHGDDRVAVVELRDGPDTTSKTRYYGISEKFSFSANDDVIVEVEIDMVAVPAIRRLLVAGAPVVKDPIVNLRVEADGLGVSSGVVAQDPALVFGRVQIASLDTTYDLDVGCAVDDVCTDGPRTLFVQVFDENGYGSTIVTSTLTVDTTPPALVPGSESVRFDANAGALVAVDAAGADARFIVSFSLTEAVAMTPTVAFAATGLRLEFLGRAIGAYQYAGVADVSVPEGLAELVVTAEDLAGNRAVLPVTLPGAGLAVDRTPPTTPGVDVPDRITFVRAPWGTSISSGTPTFLVRGDAGAVEPNAHVLVFDREAVVVDETIVGDRLGASRAAADGSFEVVLGPTDRRRVYILAVDGAGNGADDNRASLVRDVEWTVRAPASSGAIEPPVVATTLLRRSASLVQDAADVDTIGSLYDAGFGAANGVGPVAVHLPNWQRHAPAPGPVPLARQRAGLTYDPARDRAVLFGGTDLTGGALVDVWEHDGERWFEANAGGTAAPTCDDGTANGEPPFGHFVYVGGVAAPVLICRDIDPLLPSPLPPGITDSLVAYAWRNGWSPVVLTPDAAGDEPAGRVGHAVAYDAARDRVVVFGGNTWAPLVPGMAATALDDTWELVTVPSTSPDGADAMRWARMTPLGPTPPARDGHAMVDVGGEVLMFGGAGPTVVAGVGRTLLNDLWAYDGAAWRQIPTQGTWPQARRGHTLVRDPRSGDVILAGGVAAEGDTTPRNDMWRWDGAAWTEIIGDRDGLQMVHGMAMAAQPSRRHVLVVGRGVDVGVGALAHAVTFDDGIFVDATTVDTAPSYENFHVRTAYDPSERRVVMVRTPLNPTSTASVDALWWSDGGWRSVESATTPPNRYGPVLVYDEGREQMLFFGTARPPMVPATEDLWALTRDGWLDVTPPTGPFPATLTSGRPPLYDVGLGQVSLVEVDGNAIGQPSTRRWYTLSGAGWIERDQSTSIFAGEACDFAAYDRVAGGVRTMGAVPGGPWQLRSVVGLNSTLLADYGFSGDWLCSYGHLLWDHARERLLWITNAAWPKARIWELDGTTFVERATSGYPPQVQPPGVQIQYDRHRDRLVAVDVTPLGGQPGHVLTLPLDPNDRPAVHVDIDLFAAGIAKGSVESLRIAAVAVADGDQPDVELFAWHTTSGTWRSLAVEDLRAEATGDAARALVTKSTGAERLVLSVAPARPLARDFEAHSVMLDTWVVIARYRLRAPPSL